MTDKSLAEVVRLLEEAMGSELTNDFWDPKAGTAEFKATAVRIEKVG